MDLLIQGRLNIGRGRYGHGVRVQDDTKNWGTQKNSWLEMAEEELLDCVVYVIADYIRQSGDELVYRNDFFVKVGDDDNSLIMHIWKHKDRMDPCTTKTMLYSLESMLNMLARG
jgi:beta-xylosidase